MSVLVPSYNSREFIRDCISSVLAQSYFNYELIIVDDCSDDGSYEIVKSLARQHDCIKHTQTFNNTGGPAIPRNTGLEIAQGELIAFLDADDVWHPDKLSRQVNLLSETGADMVCSSVLILDSESTFDRLLVNLPNDALSDLERLSFENLIKKNRVALSSTIIRSASLGEERFSTSQRHIAVEDYHLWLRLLIDHTFCALLSADKLVAYRQRNDSLSASKLSMAKKVYAMLGEFDLSHVSFGLGRTWYFCWYIWLSIYRHMAPRSR